MPEGVIVTNASSANQTGLALYTDPLKILVLQFRKKKIYWQSVSMSGDKILVLQFRKKKIYWQSVSMIYAVQSVELPLQWND